MLTPCAESSTRAAIAAVNPPKPAAATGLLHGALEGEDEDGEDDDDDKLGADLKSGGQPNNSKPT
jgi:methionyl aminopeptidase